VRDGGGRYQVRMCVCVCVSERARYGGKREGSIEWNS
jgi:hypothetical protein